MIYMYTKPCDPCALLVCTCVGTHMCEKMSSLTFSTQLWRNKSCSWSPRADHQLLTPLSLFLQHLPVVPHGNTSSFSIHASPPIGPVPFCKVEFICLGHSLSPHFFWQWRSKTRRNEVGHLLHFLYIFLYISSQHLISLFGGTCDFPQLPTCEKPSPRKEKVLSQDHRVTNWYWNSVLPVGS